MDQATFLMNNQYDLDILDKAYSRIRETTWDHCMNAQQGMTQHKLFGGDAQDFACNEELNQKMGFPTGSYTTFIPYRLLQGNQKYILEHFVRDRELLTLREMLLNSRFSDQFIFHIADYVYMNLKCLIVQEGTYLIIPIGTRDGISKSFMDYIMTNYDDGYSQNRWFLEIRPKVSYAYAESTSLSLLNGNKIYLSQFTEKREYYKSDAINDWKVCVSDRTAELPLMRMTSAILEDKEDGLGPYLLVSDTFAEYIAKSTFNLNCFLFNEGHKVGNTISPNYIGPTGYLNTMFDEYLAAVDGARLKVVAMDVNGGWTPLPGNDKKFEEIEDLVVVGFTQDYCWVAIPTKDGVAPIYPSNFRVWEYDHERDTIGRMIATDMTVVYPNIYFYKMKSDSMMLYIEWFRDDEMLGSQYKDMTKPYRDYIGTNFYESFLNNDLPSVIQDFTPYRSHYGPTDFVKHILFYSSHEYRVSEMQKLLQETGLEYPTLYRALAESDIRYNTIVYNMDDLPNLYQEISQTIDPYIAIPWSGERTRPYDLYIDGIHIGQTKTHWKEFQQFIGIPPGLVNEHSQIIIDLYENASQEMCIVNILRGVSDSLIPLTFPLDKISGNDLVIAEPNGVRVPEDTIHYGIYSREFIIQVPFTEIDWDDLGIDPNDPTLMERIGIQVDTGDFKSVLFKLVLPMDFSYVKILSMNNEELRTNHGEILLVKSGSIIVQEDKSTRDATVSSNNSHFTKRVRAVDITVNIDNYHEHTGNAHIYNCNVHRTSCIPNLADQQTAIITAFNGANDPNRLLPFVNGNLCRPEEVSGVVPSSINTDFSIHFEGSYVDGDRAEIVYAPFPVDRFDVVSDYANQLKLAGSGVMCVMPNDILFENGKRIPVSSLVPITNQIIKAPKAGATYTIIRLHRDGNLYDFKDTSTQSFLDQLFQQSPGFKTSMGVY